MSNVAQQRCFSAIIKLSCRVHLSCCERTFHSSHFPVVLEPSLRRLKVSLSVWKKYTVDKLEKKCNWPCLIKCCTWAKCTGALMWKEYWFVSLFGPEMICTNSIQASFSHKPTSHKCLQWVTIFKMSFCVIPTLQLLPAGNTKDLGQLQQQLSITWNCVFPRGSTGAQRCRGR